MKKLLFIAVALASCLLFNSCGKDSKQYHVLDGLTYQDDSGWMTYAFKDGKCKWTMEAEYITSVQTWQYKVVGSKLYIGLDFPEQDQPIEKTAAITGTVSSDLETIEMFHKGVGISAFTVYRQN